MEVLQKNFDDVQKEYDTLLEIHQEAVEERDRFYNELQQVQRSSTPRPNWAKCSGTSLSLICFGRPISKCCELLHLLTSRHSAKPHFPFPMGFYRGAWWLSCFVLCI